MNDLVLRTLIDETVRRTNAKARGVSLAPGTVTASAGPFVLMDGDPDPIEVPSLIGPVSVGRRVMVVFYPPSGAVIVGEIGADTAWHTVGAAGEPAFQNSWVNYDATVWNPAQFRRYPNGIVQVRGLIKDGTIGNTAFTLPAGYTPPMQLLFPIVANNAFGRLDIYPNGAVAPSIGVNSFVGVNVSFSVDP